MKINNLHKTVGLILSLPFLGWVLTAMIFYIKPGYTEAYEFLEPKTYPLTENIPLPKMDSTWLEIKYLKTILGLHIIVRTERGMMQIDPQTLQPREKPNDENIRVLLKDAFSQNPQRYGEVTSISNDTIRTTTNIHVILNWNALTLYQRGPDTDRIDLLYKIHYLQWTGIRIIDKILGPLGLALIMLLSILGIRLAIKTKQR